MATSNELLRDLLVRHQIDLASLDARVQRKVVRLLDATEGDLRRRVERLLSNSAEGLTSANVRRLRTLEKSLGKIRSTAVGRVGSVWDDEMVELATMEAEFMAAALRSVAPVKLNTLLPSPDRLRAIATARPFQGRNLRQWASSLEAADRQRILTQIRVGLVQGEGADAIARRVVGTARLKGADGVTQITRNQARAITRTSINHVGNRSRQATNLANADIIDAELYVATLDSRTTRICGSLDGRQFPVGEGPTPPVHVNCRSLRVAVLDGEALGQRPLKTATERRLLREFSEREGISPVPRKRADLPRGTKGRFDGFSRKRVRELTGTTPAKTTYQDFLRRQSREFQEEVLGVEKARIFREGKVDLKKFVRPDGSELTIAQLRAKGLTDVAGLDVSLPQVGQRVESLLARGLSNQEVADAVRREFPDAMTGAKSVASVKAGLKKKGTTFPASRVDLEPSRGARQAVKDLEDGLPDGFEVPSNWLATGEVGEGVYGTYVPGRGVVLGDDLLRTTTRQHARQVVAHELGHFMHKAGDVVPSADELAALRANLARLDKDDLKRYGYYLADEDELLAEVYSQALSPSPVTSQGLSAARFSEIFVEDIAAAQRRLTRAGVKRVDPPKVAAAPDTLGKTSGRITPVVPERQLTGYQEVKDYDTGLLEQAGVRGVKLDDWKAARNANAKELIDGSEVWVRIPDNRIGSLLKDKRFKNQYETGASKAAFDPAGRRDFENKMFGTDTTWKDQDRAIYGYLAQDADGLGISSDFRGKAVSAVDQYGLVAVKLKPSVKSRTTFTSGDSLNSNFSLKIGRSEKASQKPASMSDPKATAFRQSARSTGEADFDIGDSSDIQKIQDSYMEAQVWGGLPVDEIEEVVFYEADAFRRHQAKLRTLKIPARFVSREIAT